MSSTRSRFSRVSASRNSVSRRRSRYFDTPAASSRKMRSSSGLAFDDARDHALLDDRVGARAEAGAEENVRDIAPPHVQIVDVIRRFAVALEHALDRNFAVARPLAAGLAQAVVEHQFDARAVHRLAVAGTVEQHVLHGFAAQMARRRLAEHPAHRIDDVGFAAAVGADDADQLAWHGDIGGIDEGLEAGELDFSEAQFFLCQVRVIIRTAFDRI